jgi:2-dehydropantoate 2-reductase
MTHLIRIMAIKHHILGAGAIGHLVAGLFHNVGQSVHFIDSASSQNKQHSAFCYANKSQQIMIQRLFSAPNSITDGDIIWVCVKSYQLPSALELIKQCPDNIQVLLLQNGMGNLELANEMLGAAILPTNIFVAANTHGAYLASDSELPTLHHTGIGELIIGGNYLSNDGITRSALIDSLPSSINASWHDKIESELWLKLGINAVINPLTANYQCKNGELLSNKKLHAQVDSLISELELLYKAIQLPALADAISSRCYHVIKTTADNYSSMMRDVQAGRETEIDSITGYLLNQAKECQLTLTAHQKQYDRLLNI